MPLSDEEKARYRVLLGERGYEVLSTQAVWFNWPAEVVDYITTLDPSARDTKRRATARGNSGNERRG